MDYEKRVLPELLPILHNQPELDIENDLELMRNIPIPIMDSFQCVLTSTRKIQGPASELLLKIYEPKEREQSKLPAVFWIHGGGYVLGHPDGDDALCERIAQQVNCVVASVDYRLAPEHPYPAAINDCHAALEWVVSNSEALRIDKSRLAIAGASAGGGLTAALSLLARDRGEIKIAFQMPLYPMLDDRNITPSSYEVNIENMPRAWNRENNIAAWRMYLGAKSSEEASPYAAPARAKDLEGLPPTYTCVGELDPFRDETIDYVTRLIKAKVPVEFHLYPGCFHGFDVVFNNAEISKRANREYINALSRALNK